MNSRSSLWAMLIAGVMAAGVGAAAQTQTPPTTPAPAAPATTPAADAAPADAGPKPWHYAGMDWSGFLDGYYTENGNDPTESADGKTNDLYNFNDAANHPSLSAAKLTLNHDPGLLGAHVDLIYGDTNKLINTAGQLQYVEQAYISSKPPKAKGLELDLGKWVTSAGAETIEAKDNWDYSRSLLFAYAIPYWHFGIRSALPVTKTETVGVQLVNGWNNITKSTGGVTVGLTSALTETKYTWNVNVYTGQANVPGQNGYRNLIDTTVLLTPNSKFNAYVNVDFGAQKNSISNGVGNDTTNYWDGIAFAAHEQVTGATAIAGRVEFFDDQEGFATGKAQTLKEFTGTYEYHFKVGLISRLEYRHDSSDEPFFHNGNNGMVEGQNTVTLGLIAVFAPKR